jgi:hypothetical protein
MKHIYRTTKNVTSRITWENALTGQSVGEATEFTSTAATCVFHGGKRAFAVHLAELNKEHGDGYAVAGTAPAV